MSSLRGLQGLEPGGGVYRPVKNWNLGKQAEFQERRTFAALEMAQ